MSDTTDFKANPKDYLKKHRVIMTEVGYTLTTTRFQSPPRADGDKTWEFIQTGHLDFEIAPGDYTTLDVKKLVVKTADNDTGLRVLPWKEAEMTYMKLDAITAQTFLTGPIEGCYIYVAKDNLHYIYVFHVNANNTTGAQNEQAKDAAVKRILDRDHLTLLQRLSYADYKQGTKTGHGFVYGSKTGTNWNFAVHSLSAKTKEVTSKATTSGGEVVKTTQSQLTGWEKYHGFKSLPDRNAL
jgi:hypothetical protein